MGSPAFYIEDKVILWWAVEFGGVYIKTETREMSNPKIHYYEDGKIQYEYYYLNGTYHRENGLAIIYYYEDGKIQSEYYRIEGEEYSKQQYIKLINDIKQLPEAVRLTDNRKWVREYDQS